ncbi:MAG: DUF3611 family protein [Cyanobacteria bacterium J06623_4]
MTGELGYSLSPAIRRIARSFRLLGWVGLWVQAVVGVISSLMFTIFLMGGEPPEVKAAAGLFTTPALGTVFISAFWGFRYVLFGRKLATTNPDLRPKPKAAIRIVRIGLLISLIGMALGIMGAESIVARFLSKALDQGFFALGAGGTAPNIITAGDILAMFSATNAIFALFIGLCVSLWLQYIVDR